jgi:hypothetical protein
MWVETFQMVPGNLRKGLILIDCAWKLQLFLTYVYMVPLSNSDKDV